MKKRMILNLSLYSVAISVIAFSSAPTIADEATDYGTMDAHFRTVYFNRDKKENNSDSVAASQALMLKYKSAYLGDIVGIDASGYGNLKLYGPDGKGGTGVLYDEDSGSQSSYYKLGEINLKAKFDDTADARIGRMVIDTPLLNDSDSRATPSSTQAVIGNLYFNNLGLYALASDKGSAKTDSNFGNYEDTNGDEYNIYIGGINYTFDNKLYLQAAYGTADNVQTQIYFQGKYPWAINDEMTLLFDFHQYFGDANGDGAQAGIGPDYSSSLSNLATQFQMGDLKLAASYQHVSGDAYREDWDDYANDDNGLSTWNDVQRFSFTNADEQSWQARIDYNLGNLVEGLSTMARYTHGDNITRSDDREGSEWERNIELMYSPPELENLHFRWRNAYNKSSETYNSSENRFFINYVYSVF